MPRKEEARNRRSQARTGYKHPKGTHDKGRIAEEPGEGKLSSPVLEQRWAGRLTHRLSQELRQMTDPVAVEAQLRKIGNYKFENFEIMPLFDVYIEVMVDPKIIEDWPFSGWDGGDIGHTWLIKACKQEQPCKLPVPARRFRHSLGGWPTTTRAFYLHE